jgi:pimeloyl-ACP methyl ester carboxylesterase
LGDEAIRVHRAYKQLALRLSRAGFPTLRFDYFGSGDSAGEDSEATLSRWRLDIGVAIEETRTRAETREVVLVGLRLGAALAMEIASQRQGISGLVLWEPVVAGGDYLQILAETHQDRLNYFLTKPLVKSGLANHAVERLGFVLSSTMQLEMNALNLLDLDVLDPGQQVLLVERIPNELSTKFVKYLQAQSLQVNYQCVEDPPIWREDADKALIPGQTFKTIMTWFNESFV